MTTVASPQACAPSFQVFRLFPVLLALVAAGAAAQEIAPLDLPTLAGPRYKVELIVFAYDRSVSYGNEVFVPEEPDPLLFPGEPEDEPAMDEPLVYEDPSLLATEPAGEEDQPQPLDDIFAAEPATRRIALELLDRQDARIEEIHRKLANLGAYHPLMRAAWVQSTPAKAEAPAIHLQALGGAPPELDGTVTLYLGRFVHLVVDVAMDAGDEAAEAAPRDAPVYFGDDRPGGYFGAPVLRYRISEDRIMRDGDVRYFDHPRFGVIARVTRVNTSDPENLPTSR